MVGKAKPVETGGKLCVGFIKAVAVRCWALIYIYIYIYIYIERERER